MDDSKISDAIIIKRNDWRESDSRVVLYAKNFGKLALIARGVKKLKSKLAGHIEPISIVKAMILKGRSYDYLGGAIISRAHINIKNDLNALYFAGSALAMIDKRVKEEVADVELYDFIVYWLQLLDDRCANGLDKESGELLYNYFCLRFLSILGYKPELYHCLDCHQPIKPGSNYFSLRHGGLICSACFEASKSKYLPNEVLPISDDCIKILRLFCQDGSYQSLRIETKLRRELTRVVKSFIQFN